MLDTGESSEKQGALVPSWWEFKLVSSFWRVIFQFYLTIKSLKICAFLLFDPTVLLLGISSTPEGSWGAFLPPWVVWRPVDTGRKVRNKNPL